MATGCPEDDGFVKGTNQARRERKIEVGRGGNT
jgi:hypothetical protein